ncbi:hybrid sensor histidine kinase/response regulator [Methanosphaerula palustris]|nr:PAS domain S-box protein [Methanosphaerula palustris]
MTDSGSESTKNKISILYVDDEQDLLTVTKFFLERAGEFRVDTMTSAQEALNSPLIQSYDVIISDYQMPGMDGIAFLKAVRERFGTIAFILFTGRGREEVVIDAINNGADFYLQKGGEPKSQFAELTHQIRRAVQQRRAEISIRDLERREADIIDFLPDATFAIDRFGTIIAWNRAMEEMTGVPTRDILGKGDYEYSIPFYGQRQPSLIDLINEANDVITKKYAQITQQKDTLIADSTITMPTGKTISFIGKASPLYNQQGEVVGAIETIRDITELKSAEESLRESEGRFSAFMEHLPVTAFIKDDQSTNLFVNRRMVEVFGEQEWIGTSVYNQFPKEAAEKMVEDDHQTLRDGYRRTIETLQGRDGTKKIYETYKFRIDREKKPPLIGGFAVDITDQKQVEDALRESEERYRNVVEDQTEFISRFLPDGTHVFVNEAYCGYFGMKRDEILGHRFRPNIPIEDQEPVKQFFESLTPDHPADSIEHRIIMPDGTIRWHRWNDHAIFDPSGTIVEYQSVGQDITEQRQKEQVLYENEQHLNSIYNTVEDVIYQLTVEPGGQYRFTSVNAAFSRITGIPTEEIFGKTVNEIIPEPSLSMVLEKYRQAIDEKTLVHWEEISVYPNGQLTGEVSIAPIFDTEGNCTHLIGSVHDITERKRIEHTLRESEEKFRSLAESSPDYIMRYDQKCRHTYMNPAALLASGLTKEQIIGKTHRESGYDDDLSKFWEERITGVFETRKPFQTQFAWDSVDGRVVLDWMLTPEFSDDGTVRSVLGVSRDITQLKLIEEELLRKNEELYASYEQIAASEEELRSNLEELRRQEMALRESEERYRKIFENSPLGMVLATPDFRFISVNPTWVTMTGYSEEELIHLSFTDITHPDNLAGDLEHMKDLAAGTIPVYGTEKRYIRKDGSILWGLLRVTAIRDHQGSLSYFAGQIEDITERKLADDALLESEEKYHNLYRNSTLGIFHSTMEGKFIDVNPAMARMLGYTDPEEVVTAITSIADQVYVERPMYDSVVQGMLEGGGIINRENHYRRRDGTQWYGNLNLRIVPDQQGKPHHYEGFVEDITERKLAEETLRTSKDQYDTMVSHIPVGIYILRGTPEGSCSFDFVSPKLAEMFNVSAENFLADQKMGFEPIHLDDLRSLLKLSYEKYYQKRFQQPQLFEWDGRTLVGGEVKWIHIESSPVLQENGDVLWNGIVTDITERRRAEEGLRRANRKLTLLSGITRHDLKNQILSLNGYLEISKEYIDDAAKMSEYLTKEEEITKKIEGQIAFTEEYEAIGVNAPTWQDCRTLVEIASQQASLGNITVKNDIPSKIDVFADPLIIKVFYNLMDNAVRHGGTITTIRFSAQESGADLRVICEDDGIGILAGVKEKIFDHGVGKNTGLGLFLTREILSITDIIIQENGEPGKGARFEITVPKKGWTGFLSHNGVE